MSTKSQNTINVFDNPNVNRDYLIEFNIPEFTCLCPLTGQPDFAEFHIKYIPNKLCIELKSLKLYFWSYRDKKDFHEAVTNKILEYLAKTIKPRYLSIKADFNVRGGIYTSVSVTYKDDNWSNDSSIV